MIQVKNFSSPQSTRKRLGAFYTPKDLSQVLMNWAIKSEKDRVLEPGFGQCGFLIAARHRFEALHSKAPQENIFGCDIDPNAAFFLEKSLIPPLEPEHFLQEDFLDLLPGKQWPYLFEAVVGNPPYIPFQAISKFRRDDYADKAKELGITIGKRASLWAYFIVHAISFVVPGGRMAWVLPGAFLQANYATGVRQLIKQTFSASLCILMTKRFFKEEGTEEETAVLLAKNKCNIIDNGEDLAFAHASSVQELIANIEKWEAGKWAGRYLDARPSYLCLEENVSSIFEKLREHDECKKLSDYLKIKIGLVTGANAFFVLKDEEVIRLGLHEKDTIPILSKFKAVKGLYFTIADNQGYKETGGRTRLVHSVSLPSEGFPLRTYLDTFTYEQRSKIHTFQKRAIWHAPDDGNYPDAFFPVMHHNGPRIALNDAKINCTNTIHRVFFKEGVHDKQKKLLTISLLTSFSQLSSEFVGRRYGSGVLKHEPREAEKIEILMPKNISDEAIEVCYCKIDTLLRSGNHEEAYKEADRLILKNIPIPTKCIETLHAALAAVRNLRRATPSFSDA